MKKITLFLALALCATGIYAQEDTRTIIHSVSFTGFPTPEFGDAINGDFEQKLVDSLTPLEGAPYRLSSNTNVFIYDESTSGHCSLINYSYGETFKDTLYQVRIQLRCDHPDYRLPESAEDITVLVDGDEWSYQYGTKTSTFSYADIRSPFFRVVKKALPLKFSGSLSFHQDFYTDSLMINMDLKSSTVGGTEVYTYSKKSNHISWLQVASDGILTGTPDEASNNSQYDTLLVSDGNQTIDIPVYIPIIYVHPSQREIISTFTITDFPKPQYGELVNAYISWTADPEYIKSGNPTWQKYNTSTGKWGDVSDGNTFEYGSYRLHMQIRIDRTNQAGYSYRIADNLDDITVTINGDTVTEKIDKYIGSNYSYFIINTPTFYVGEAAVGDTIVVDHGAYKLYYLVTKAQKDDRTVQLICPNNTTYYPAGEFPSGDVVIPATVQDRLGFDYKVTRVGSNAFRNCSGITSIELGENVNDIYGGAFNECTSLTKLTALYSGYVDLAEDMFVNVPIDTFDISKYITPNANYVFSGNTMRWFKGGNPWMSTYDGVLYESEDNDHPNNYVSMVAIGGIRTEDIHMRNDVDKTITIRSNVMNMVKQPLDIWYSAATTTFEVNGDDQSSAVKHFYASCDVYDKVVSAVGKKWKNIQLIGRLTQAITLNAVGHGTITILDTLDCSTVSVRVVPEEGYYLQSLSFNASHEQLHASTDYEITVTEDGEIEAVFDIIRDVVVSLTTNQSTTIERSATLPLSILLTDNEEYAIAGQNIDLYLDDVKLNDEPYVTNLIGTCDILFCAETYNIEVGEHTIYAKYEATPAYRTGRSADLLITIIDTPTALNENENESENRKVVENGQVIILRNGLRYNLLGTVVE